MAIAITDTQRAFATIDYHPDDLCALPPGFTILADEWIAGYATRHSLSGEAEVLSALGITDERGDNA